MINDFTLAAIDECRDAIRIPFLDGPVRHYINAGTAVVDTLNGFSSERTFQLEMQLSEFAYCSRTLAGLSRVLRAVSSKIQVVENDRLCVEGVRQIFGAVLDGVMEKETSGRIPDRQLRKRILYLPEVLKAWRPPSSRRSPSP